MPVHVPHRLAAALVVGGALGVAVTTALEVVTAPYSSAVSLYPLNGAVHLGKVAAVLAFTAGLLGLVEHWGNRLGRVGSVAGLALAVAALAGAVPYSIIEASLDPDLTPAAASSRLDAIYADQVWVGILASVAMPIILLSVLTLAAVVLRRRLLPAWAPVGSLAMVLLGIAVVVLSESTGVALPHPPAWIFLGLAGYGAASLVTDRADRRPLHAQPT